MLSCSDYAIPIIKIDRQSSVMQALLRKTLWMQCKVDLGCLEELKKPKD